VGERPGSFSVYWAVKEDSDIKTIADMKDRSVGTNVFGSGNLSVDKSKGLPPSEWKRVLLLRTLVTGPYLAARLLLFLEDFHCGSVS
jgi:hypothetical protein